MTQLKILENCVKHHTLTLNNSKLGDFVDLIYPIELEIKNTTDADRSASYLDLNLQIDSQSRLRTNFYDKRFNFPIVNFPFICSNIQQNLHMKNIYLSSDPKFQTFGSYQDVLERGLLLTKKLLNQWFILVKLKSYGRHHNLVNRYGLCVTNAHGYVEHFPGLSSLMTYHWVYNQSNTTGALVEQELFVLPEHLHSPQVVTEVRAARSLVFCVVFCRSLFGLCVVCPSSIYGF